VAYILIATGKILQNLQDPIMTDH